MTRRDAYPHTRGASAFAARHPHCRLRGPGPAPLEPLVGESHQPPGQTHAMGRARKGGKKKRKFITVVRDAITGRFLRKGAAKRRPRTTVTQRVPLKRRGKKRRR